MQPPKDLPRPQRGDRTRNLDFLFGALKAAPDADSAKQVENRIWALWLASGSDTANLLMSRVKTAIEAKDLDLAIKLLDAIVKIKPDYVEAWNRRATIHYMRKEFGQSLQDIRQVLRASRATSARMSGLGMILQEFGDEKHALDVFRRALEIHPHLQKIPDLVKTPDREGRGPGYLTPLLSRSESAHSLAASAPTKAIRIMLVAPGVPSGTPATMMTRRPALAKPSLNASRQARSTMSSWSRASSATTQWMPQATESLRPVERLGEIATIGTLRPLARHAQAGRAGAGPADDGRKIERLGDLARGRGDGVGAGGLGLGVLRLHDRVVGVLALHLLGDPVHGGDRLDRKLPGGRFRRQHDGVGAVEDRGRDVGHLGAGRHRARDHAFEHLRRHHHRLAGAARGAGDLLLDARHLLQRHLHAEIAARHHQRVGRCR